MGAIAAIATLMLATYDQGPVRCEKAAKAISANPSTYRTIRVAEDPGQTRAMTYYIIDYLVKDSNGKEIRERVHCSYMRDTGVTTPHRISSERPYRKI